jgi:hypothetical protein
MGRECSTHEEKKIACRLLLESQREGENWEDINLKSRMIEMTGFI